MRLIDADKFKEDLMKLWDYSCVDGITATTVLKQVLHDLDNAQTVIWCSETSEGYPLMDLRPKEEGECRTCRHRDPEDKKCDCGELERAGCPFPVSDDYYCKYYEKGGKEC